MSEQNNNYFIGNRVFIIAEAGANWKRGSFEQDIRAGKKMIDVAKQAGASAVKFQTYKDPLNVYVENAGDSDYLARMGIKQPIAKVLQGILMSDKMIAELSDYCEKRDIIFMSTPFSVEAAKALAPYTAIQKIGSYEISYPDLIEFAGKSKKPLILSTGAASIEDIQWAVDFFYKAGGEKIALMQCTGKYPAPLSTLNLKTIPEMAKIFKAPIGFSDHSREPIIGPVAAVALGAEIIEKHFTLDNNLPGPDHSFAVLPEELREMVKAIRDCEKCLGPGKKQVQETEKELYLFAQRGVQAIKNIKQGEILKQGENIAVLRPGKQKKGIHPKFLKEIKGRKAKRALLLGDGIQREDF